VFFLDRGLLMGAITTGSSISISSTYILFLTKLQKRQTPEKGSALFENCRYAMSDISKVFETDDILRERGDILSKFACKHKN
jgi:hypothetical protein